MNLLVSKTQGNWKGSFAGTGSINIGGKSHQISLPKEFRGRGDGTTPEDLVLSALSSCYLITLGIILDKANIEYSSLSIECDLQTEISALPSIRKAILKPTLVSNAAQDVLLKKLKEAEKKCLISRALDGNIEKVLEPIFLTNPV